MVQCVEQSFHLRERETTYLDGKKLSELYSRFMFNPVYLEHLFRHPFLHAWNTLSPAMSLSCEQASSMHEAASEPPGQD